MNNNTTPNIIEEIPSHELYASIVGISASASSTSTSVRRVHPPLLANLIPTTTRTTTTRDIQSSTPLTAVYQKATMSGTKMSCLKLDTSNKGFQLLQQLGWQEQDGGLGRYRQGSLEPIKTIRLNCNNKKGLCPAIITEARITHVTPPSQTNNSTSTFQERKKETKGQRKRQRHLNHENEGRIDKEIRFLLQTNETEEYEQLYRSIMSPQCSTKRRK